MIERELIANWNSVMYPEPEPEASMPEPYGMEQMEQFQVAQAPTDQPLGFGGVSPGQFARGALDTGAAVVKGAAQGFVGLPGDLEEIGRLLINLVGGDLDEKAYLATTDDIKKMLDQFAPLNARMGEREQKVSETVGELVAPGGYLKGIKEGVRGLKKGAEVLAPKAGEMIENYLTRTGLMLRLGPEGKSVEVPAAGDVTKPAFKRWFGESKVLSSENKPLVMYHGTSATEKGEAFSSFKTESSNYGLMGMGGYFTADPKVASSYTAKGRGDSPTVYPVYLSIKNPIDMDAPANANEWIKQFDGIEQYLEGGTTNESWYRAAEEMLMDDRIPMWEGAEIMQDALRSMGYDGITHIGGGRVKADDVRHRVFIAFDPEQVKSVFNKGTWNPNDPRIVNSLGAGGSAIGAGAVTMPQTQQEPQ
jgi:hypothetical protein